MPLSSRALKLSDEFRALSTDEREAALLELAEITDQQAPAKPLHAEWHDELVRRVRSVQDGTSVLHDWEDVERELEEVIRGKIVETADALVAQYRRKTG